MVVLAQSPLEVSYPLTSDIMLTLCEFFPLHLVISLQPFPMLMFILPASLPWPWVGERPSASPPPASLQSLSWSAVCWSSDRLITIQSGLVKAKGSPQIHSVPLWLPTFWNQTFQTNRSHSPRRICPSPSLIKFDFIGCNVSLPDVLS